MLREAGEGTQLHAAETAKQVATLVATAKSQYPLAVGRALERLKRSPRVFEAYNERITAAEHDACARRTC